MSYQGSLIKPIPDLEINGHYIRTSYIVNGQPVYLKIYGQQYVVPDMWRNRQVAQRNQAFCENTQNRICLMITTDRKNWIVKTQAYANDILGHAYIESPQGVVVQDLHEMLLQLEKDSDAAAGQTAPKKLTLVDYPEATISLTSIENAMADIATIAETHVRRQNLHGNRYECQACGEEKDFADFIALQCGHALCCQACHEANLKFLDEHPDNAKHNCWVGCRVTRHRYHKVTEHSDYAPLYMADPSPEAVVNMPGGTGNCYLTTARAVIVKL